MAEESAAAPEDASDLSAVGIDNPAEMGMDPEMDEMGDGDIGGADSADIDSVISGNEDTF